jgi:hypothetical protein
MKGEERTSGEEELYLLRHDAVRSGKKQLTFRRDMSPPSSASKSKPRRILMLSFARCLLHGDFSLFDTEDGRNKFLRNVS